MADRKNKRAYLDDFARDLNGNYEYRGAYCHYTGSVPRRKRLARLWGLCAAASALAVGAGFVPGATARAAVYVSLPYMAALLAVVYSLWALVRMTAGGEPLRAYIHEQTVQKLPGRCLLAAVLCGVAAAGQLVSLVLAGFSAARLIYLVMLAAAAGLFIAARDAVEKMEYKKD